MIIKQTIVNGLCVINKTGAYFGLVSASGIVRVKLLKAGSVVLESDMWVGMLLPSAILFDEIQLMGQDSAIEVWAGDIAMSQSAVMTRGAAALRTNIIPVHGKNLLTGFDVTRQSVRIRPNADIIVGGAGMGKQGWNAPANQVTELPVAGLLYGYFAKPYIDLANTSTGAYDAQYWKTMEPAGGGGGGMPMSIDTQPHKEIKAGQGGSHYDAVYESPDKTVRLVSGFDGTFILNNSAQWVLHNDVIHDFDCMDNAFLQAANGDLYLIYRIDNDLHLYQSADFGQTFTKLMTIAPPLFAPLDNYRVAPTQIVNNLITFGFNQYAVVIDVTQLTHENIAYSSQQQAIRYLALTANRHLRIVPVGNDYHLQLSVDAGQNWQSQHDNAFEYTDFGGITADNTGKHVMFTTAIDEYMCLSDNSGDSFINSGLTIAGTNTCYFAAGIYLVTRHRDLFAMYIEDSGVVETLLLQNLRDIRAWNPLFISSNGNVRSVGVDLDADAGGSLALNIPLAGNLNPAIVEVMELLG